MGSLIMHLCIANKLKDKYKFSDKFVIGSLMPDLLKMAGKDKEKTHYLEEVIENSGVKHLPNVLKYEDENRENITSEKVLGYATHLVQDKVWFDNYIGKYAKLDANDTEKVEYLQYNQVKSDKEFSNDIYKDYDNINRYIIDKYNLDVNHVKQKIKEIAPDKELADKIDKCFSVSKEYKDNTNTFITKEDVDTYIKEAVRKSSIEINKMLGKV